MSLEVWTACLGVAYITARRQYAAGTLPGSCPPAWPADHGGRAAGGEGRGGQVVVHARVSSADQRAGLDRQVAVTAWATGQQLAISRVVARVSALDGERREFLALLRDEPVTTIVAGGRADSPGSAASTWRRRWPAHGRRLLVADSSGADEDLVADVTETLTSLCARRYGARGAADRAARAVAAVTGDGR